MILLVTNRRDVTTDFVVAELVRRGQPFHRFNSDAADPGSLTLVLDDSGTSWSLDCHGERLDADVFRAGYFRRPALPDTIIRVDPAYREHVTGEWAALLNSFYAALNCRWLSDPHCIALAEDKPRQLTVAHRLGFKLPHTLVAASYDTVALFVGAAPSVAKPIRSGRLVAADEETIAFTSRIGAIGPQDAVAVSLSPVIYQREIRKVCDIRVTVVGQRVFACEIRQVDDPDVDWRRKDVLGLEYRPRELPQSLAARCVALVEALHLGFGAIDLVQDDSGEYWFLEINPNGQWAWIEQQTRLPIASAIVDLLIDRAQQ